MAKTGLSIKEKVRHTLEETRVVLPGTQALLGFQLVCVFSPGFEKLSSLLKDIHVLSLLFITLTIMFLMTPAAYHSIVEEGNDTERFHGFTSKMLLLAMALLAIGLNLDIFLVVSVITKSFPFALSVGVVSLLLYYLTWFGYSLFVRETKT